MNKDITVAVMNSNLNIAKDVAIGIPFDTDADTWAYVTSLTVTLVIDSGFNGEQAFDYLNDIEAIDLRAYITHVHYREMSVVEVVGTPQEQVAKVVANVKLSPAVQEIMDNL